MLFAARKGDAFTCPTHGGGVIQGPCCFHVQIGGAPAARAGDAGACRSSGIFDTIRRGNPTVLIAGEPAAGITHPTAHGGNVLTGCGNVFIGDPPVDKDGNLLPVPPECAYLWKGLQTVPMGGAPAEGLDELRDAFWHSRGRSGIWTFPHRDAPERVRMYDVVIRGHRITIVEPESVGPAAGQGHTTTTGRWLPSPAMVAGALATLSDEQLSRLHTAVITPHDYPDDPSKPASAACGGGVVSFHPRAEAHPQSDIDWAVAHEGAHALAHDLWGPDLTARSWDRWRHAVEKDGRNVSGYGGTDIGEDFAEAVLMYALTKGTPCEATARAMFPNRYAELDKLFPTGYRPRRRKP